MIKLSDGVQRLPRQVTQNVHGAARSFLEVGEQSAQTAKSEAKSAWCMPCAHCELSMPTCSRPLLQGLLAAARGADRWCLHAAGGKPRFTKGAYVLGKIVWGKGEQLSVVATDCLAPRLSRACMGLFRNDRATNNQHTHTGQRQATCCSRATCMCLKSWCSSAQSA